MKKTAAWLAVYALEQLGIRHTFGIPGVHNTELYDELNNSEPVTPVLVTHEGGAAFMADGLSRASDTPAIGTLAIVPAAGFTHAASGIGEAFLDGIPMLVISGGIRTDTGNRYQLHEIDQLALAAPLTKGAFRITEHREVVATFFAAYQLAISGKPGPVLIELPVNLQLFPGEVDELPIWTAPEQPVIDAATEQALEQATALLLAARKPGIFVGWGGRQVTDILIQLAEYLQAPVSTTLQGLASFPGNHPLHAGFGFSPSAVPAARNAFKGCDLLLAIGTRFGEIPTGSFNAPVPAQLIHLDIDPEVFDANYPARVKLAGDSRLLLPVLLQRLQQYQPRPLYTDLQQDIALDKAAYRKTWQQHDSQGLINPLAFFDELRQQLPDDAILVLDDGNHTFLTAELFPIHLGGRLLTPTDFNAMGYAVPAAIGAKLAQPHKEVVAILGDGCFLMTGMEMLTATHQGLGVVYCIFNDGELSQIAQAQQIPYNRKTCTRLPPAQLEGIALATGAAYLRLDQPEQLTAILQQARNLAAAGQPVVVDVAIDYSKRTAFTSGTAASTFKRFPLSQRLRFAGRALLRKLTG